MSVGNPLLAIGEAVPARIAEAREERDRHVARALELSTEIAKLEMLVAVTATTNGQVAGPESQGLEAGSSPVRRARHRDSPEPPPAASPP